MMWYTSSPSKGIAINVGFFVVGVSLFAVGAHFSYKNIAPQQARIKARSDLLKAHLKRKFGYGDDMKPKVLPKSQHSRTDGPNSIPRK